MAKPVLINLTVPQTSINDGIPLHTWRLNVNKALSGLQSNTANSGNVTANVAAAYAQANAARLQANTAFSAANRAANTVAVYADGLLVLPAANINFQNTANITFSTSPDVAHKACNVSVDFNSAYTTNVINRIVASNPNIISYFGVL